MTSTATMLGLSGSSTGTSTPSHGPYYLIFHFVFAYGILSSRTLKQYLGIDNNVNPRENSATIGEVAVRSGKITRAQLDMVRRNEAAHANAVENYTLFVAGVLAAQAAGVPGETVNRMAAVYTVARVGYALAYLFIESRAWSQVRGILWWTGNVSCLHLLWTAGKLSRA